MDPEFYDLVESEVGELIRSRGFNAFRESYYPAVFGDAEIVYDSPTLRLRVYRDRTIPGIEIGRVGGPNDELLNAAMLIKYLGLGSPTSLTETVASIDRNYDVLVDLFPNREKAQELHASFSKFFEDLIRRRNAKNEVICPATRTADSRRDQNSKRCR